MRQFIKLITSNLLTFFLFPTLIPLFVFVRNFSDTPPGVFFRVALISIVFFVVMMGIVWMVFKESRRTIVFGCVTFLMLILYGNLYDVLIKSGSFLGHHKILAPLFMVSLLISAIFINKKKISRNVLFGINAFSILFFALQIGQLIPKINAVSKSDYASDKSKTFESRIKRDIRPIAVNEQVGTPDIYYIILDMYARSDKLIEYFNYDNSQFLDDLESIGFFVADCSRSNYVQTSSSIASSLNLDYLQALSDEFSPENTDPELAIYLVQNPNILKLMDSLEYETYTFETGYDFSEIRSSDHYLSPPKPNAFLGSIHPYEILILKGSIFRILNDTHIPFLDPLYNRITFPYHDHVVLQDYILKNLVEISRNSTPTFTFAHITIPHTPFIFRSDGSYTLNRKYFSGLYEAPVSEDLFSDGYINQVQYINQKILEVVREILENSPTPPVIILQGDHGAILEDRLPILNAYYFPLHQKPGLYSSISPVNTFRLLLDDYFSGDYPILEDQSYNSNYNYQYDWVDTPEQSEKCSSR